MTCAPPSDQRLRGYHLFRLLLQIPDMARQIYEIRILRRVRTNKRKHVDIQGSRKIQCLEVCDKQHTERKMEA